MVGFVSVVAVVCVGGSACLVRLPQVLRLVDCAFTEADAATLFADRFGLSRSARLQR
jgi:hypothetical protein